MTKLRYVKAEPLSLKAHPEFNERWLQDRISEDPSILGLGEVELVARERRQEGGGRLDLLLADANQEMRYEVELMLGPTDESHMIRCIEYWDKERRLYPAYDHYPVLVAEDITTRFLNVLGLFAGSIPLLAIQLNALRVEDMIVLDFVTVVDQTSLRRDDETEESISKTDRAYWEGHSSQAMLKVVDDCFAIIDEKAKGRYSLSYKKQFIGLRDDHRARNFIIFKPRKQYVDMMARVSKPQDWMKKIEAADIEVEVGPKRPSVWVTLDSDVLLKHTQLIRELIHASVTDHQSD